MYVHVFLLLKALNNCWCSYALVVSGQLLDKLLTSVFEIEPTKTTLTDHMFLIEIHNKQYVLFDFLSVWTHSGWVVVKFRWCEASDNFSKPWQSVQIMRSWCFRFSCSQIFILESKIQTSHVFSYVILRKSMSNHMCYFCFEVFGHMLHLYWSGYDNAKPT